jgi:peptidase E
VNILATSGGFRANDRYTSEAGPLVQHALRLSGADRPRFCFVGTATGDSDRYLTLVYAAMAALGGVDTSHLALFPMPNVDDIRSHLLDQHVIYVGGGSVANLLAVWQLHDVDIAMREAWQAGVVLTGVSAGSICWHTGGPTDSFGPRLRPVTSGLGLLPYGNGVHYDSEEQRRPLLHRLVGDGTLPMSYATDDGVGLHYAGTELVEAVADRPDAAAYRIERQGGIAVESRIEPGLLPVS